jgi:hypothetical protein
LAAFETELPTRGPLRQNQGLPGDVSEALMVSQQEKRSLAVWVEGWIPTNDFPPCSHIYPLAVGKGMLDCLSVPQRWQQPK